MTRLCMIFLAVLLFTACNLETEMKADSSDNFKLIDSTTINPSNVTGFDKFFPIVENKLLSYLKFNSKKLAENYCKGSITDISVDIISINPLIVNCDQYSISNGIWEYDLYKNDQRVIGANKKYVLLSDLTLIDKHSGKPTENNEFKKNILQHGGLKKYSYDSLAVSENNRFFVSSKIESKSYIFFEKTSIIFINEILKNEYENPIIKLLKNSSGHLQVVKMAVSDEGEYLFLVVENSKRGPVDLYFYVIDVKHKNVIFKKTLEKNSRYQENIFLDYENNKILLSYSSPLKIYLYEVKEF